MGFLLPAETVDSIHEIDYERLRAQGIRALLFDLDNTLGPRRAHRLRPEVYALLERLEADGFRVGVLSNRRRLGGAVIDELCNRFALLQAAGKPGRVGFLVLLAELEVAPGEAAMIGDRYLTDVIGANRLGMHAIRVRRHGHASR
ncbi:MAG: HAD-IIIA family hydrolase [Candidatus Bipolaricaulota bacterium]|nr:MAG: HAD-IIIA family hydrolase [Candidatus Bipolaricaulota bacterium]